MKQFSLLIITKIFDMFLGLFKKVQQSDKRDTPGEEWAKFILFLLLSFGVIAVALWFSAELIGAP